MWLNQPIENKSDIKLGKMWLVFNFQHCSIIFSRSLCKVSIKRFKMRGANFTESEIAELITLVTKYKHIVECKKTDTVTNG